MSGSRHAGRSVASSGAGPTHLRHVFVIDRDTGEILRELDIDPTKDSQPRGVKPGPRPGHRKGGMPKGYKYPPK